MSDSEYPEHDKMATRRVELDAVADFLEDIEAGKLTAAGARLHLCILGVSDGDSQPKIIVPVNIPHLLEQWSGIDQNVLEKEKRAMLEKQRALNDEGT